ncbi:HAD family hydrolase [Patescibacteria group bacterium]
MIKIIIFDLDGLLIDSQPLQYEAFNQAFSEKGYPINEKDWHKEWIHGGMSPKKWVEMHNLSLDSEKIRARKKEIYDRLIKTKLELKPGALSLLRLLEGNYRMAIASSSRIESIELSVDKFDLRPKFEHLISDVDLDKEKPHPEIFLHTAKIMKVEPEYCLVIEDSLAGLQAAKSAGMKCIICPDPYSNKDNKKFVGADVIVDRLDEISLEMIDKM